MGGAFGSLRTAAEALRRSNLKLAAMLCFSGSVIAKNSHMYWLGCSHKMTGFGVLQVPPRLHSSPMGQVTPNIINSHRSSNLFHFCTILWIPTGMCWLFILKVLKSGVLNVRNAVSLTHIGTHSNFAPLLLSPLSGSAASNT